MLRFFALLALAAPVSAAELSWNFYEPSKPGGLTGKTPAPDTGGDAPFESAPRISKPRSYADARQEAIHKGKPLVVWVGEARCPNCVQHNREEFVHFLAESQAGFPADSLTVGVPVDGELVVAGQVTHWPDGHIPTVREILRRWRADRRKVTDASFQGDPGWSDVWERPARRTVRVARPAYSYSYPSQPRRFVRFAGG